MFEYLAVLSMVSNAVELLTILRKRFTILIGTLVRLRKGYGMSTHEIELFKIIYENDNPEKAVLTAIEVFTAILEQPSAVPVLQPVCLQESF